jgi:hypothetical protein
MGHTVRTLETDGVVYMWEFENLRVGITRVKTKFPTRFQHFKCMCTWKDCSCMLLMVGREAPETCWATHKRQVINLWNCYILLVNLFESDFPCLFSNTALKITFHTGSPVDINWSASTTLPGDVSLRTLNCPYITEPYTRFTVSPCSKT